MFDHARRCQPKLRSWRNLLSWRATVTLFQSNLFCILLQLHHVDPCCTYLILSILSWSFPLHFFACPKSHTVGHRSQTICPPRTSAVQSRIWELLRGCYDILRYVTICYDRWSKGKCRANLFLVGSRQNSTTDNDDGSDDWDGRECGQKWLGWWPTSWGCRMWTRMWQARIKMRRSYVFLNTKLAPKMKAIQCQKLSKKIPQPLQTCWIGSSNAHVQAQIEPPLHNRKSYSCAKESVLK